MTEATMTIRPVTELDIDSIVEIDESITGKYRSGHWETQVGYYMQRDQESALVAEEDGKILGFVFGDIRGWEFGLEQRTGWIEVIGVRPEAQSKGIAKSMIEQLLAHWRDAKVGEARTMVDNSDEGLNAFMSKLGMQATPVTTYRMDLS